MTKSPLIASALLGVSILGLSAAHAQEERSPREGHRGHPPHARMAEMDVNGDGVISLDEIQSRETEQFANVDANNDGQVDAAEMVAFQEARRAEQMRERESRRVARMIEHLDADGDGSLSVEEFTSRPREMFARLDTDGDGQISAEEREAMREARRERFAERGHRRGDRDGHRGRHHRFERGDAPAADAPAPDAD